MIRSKRIVVIELSKYFALIILAYVSIRLLGEIPLIMTGKIRNASIL